MKILYGMQRPDEGTIAIDGEVRHFRSPTDAIAAGIGMVHQHFMLADNLTVTENIILGDEPRRRGLIDFRRRPAGASTSWAAATASCVDPDELVETLGVGERQRVEILKVLYRGARILILDEPTAVLVPQEVESLFRNLAELKAEGITIIFISHKLDEVLSVADSITVIRAGTTVATARTGGDHHRRAGRSSWSGSELPDPRDPRVHRADDVGLSVDDLCVTEDGRPSCCRDISFEVRRGEVVGIAGVEGNGQTELIEALMGLRAIDAGRIRLGGEDITAWPTRRRREAGLGYVPEDRQRHGLLLEAPLWENQMLGHQTQPPNARGPWIDRDGARARTTEIVADYDVRTPSIDVPRRRSRAATSRS